MYMRVTLCGITVWRGGWGACISCRSAVSVGFMGLLRLLYTSTVRRQLDWAGGVCENTVVMHQLLPAATLHGSMLLL